MQKVQLEIIGLSYSQSQTGAYALILAEREGQRRLPIIIGGYEAQSIAIELEDMKPSRPLTHDLFLNLGKEVGVSLTEVYIHKLLEGIFYADLYFDYLGKTIKVDSRTSDAVALALRFNAPIFTSEEIMNTAGIIVNDDDEIESAQGDAAQEKEGNASPHSGKSIEDLEKELNEAIANENYELASELRDTINKRKDN